jgi:hypothetical protein
MFMGRMQRRLADGIAVRDLGSLSRILSLYGSHWGRVTFADILPASEVDLVHVVEAANRRDVSICYISRCQCEVHCST